ncbi:MAG: c-type cytochrome [Pseudomonadota bacterium]
MTSIGYAQTAAQTAAPTPAASSAAPAASAAAQKTSAPMGAKSLEAKTAMCFGCHNIKGYQASFPEVHKVPMIAGQSAKYIVAALKEYKAGDRKHPTMRGIATTLSEQDMTDIAGFYEGLGAEGAPKAPAAPSKTPDPQVAALLQKAACVSCHGANFSAPIDVYPKIAGQHADYLFVALKAYKADNNPAVGRSNGVMGAIAKQFSNDELKALAKYVGSLDGDLKTVPEHRFRH